jgi:hypothetical protein
MIFLWEGAYYASYELPDGLGQGIPKVGEKICGSKLGH